MAETGANIMPEVEDKKYIQLVVHMDDVAHAANVKDTKGYELVGYTLLYPSSNYCSCIFRLKDKEKVCKEDRDAEVCPYCLSVYREV